MPKNDPSEQAAAEQLQRAGVIEPETRREAVMCKNGEVVKAEEITDVDQQPWTCSGCAIYHVIPQHRPNNEFWILCPRTGKEVGPHSENCDKQIELSSTVTVRDILPPFILAMIKEHEYLHERNTRRHEREMRSAEYWHKFFRPWLWLRRNHG